MIKFVRFLLFFVVCFPALFLSTAGIAFLHVWIDAVSGVPVKTSIYLTEIVNSGCWILPFTLYLSIIFSINYGNRRKVNRPLVFLSLLVLASLFTFGASKCLNSVYRMIAPPLAVKHMTLGHPGMILSQAGTVTTLLDNPSNRVGSRVVSISGSPLIYQKAPIGANGEIISLPPVPFRTNSKWIYNATLGDLSFSGRYIAARFEEGAASYFSWICALTVLLVSLGFLTEASNWPLANIFLGIMVFRGILAFEVFLNSEEVSGFLSDLLRGTLPDMLISPIIFTAIAILILIYAILLLISRIPPPPPQA
ncbi:MAG: hypothetical protein LBP37_06110 [Spirochaetaceae bacterium]|jgi:hypothetical protein|nr:hypothetical protein [Spirochaetaceae bacterium]